jgi:hypothetical protein
MWKNKSIILYTFDELCEKEPQLIYEFHLINGAARQLMD